MLCLAKGDKPGRPETPILNDSHWDLIQDCWSAIEERPAAGVIIPTIEHFLSHCPLSPPLCDLPPAWSSQVDLGAESSSLSKNFTTGSHTHVAEAVSDENDQNRYIVMFISLQFIILISLHLHLSGSLCFLMYRGCTNPARASNAAYCYQESDRGSERVQQREVSDGITRGSVSRRAFHSICSLDEDVINYD